MTAQPRKISVPSTLSNITNPWSPKLIASVNATHDVKVAKLRGSFIWHSHENTDELFYIISGSLKMRFRDESGETQLLDDVVLEKGDMLVVPKGVRHCPVVEDEEEAEIMMVELRGTVNTGDADGNEALALRKEAEDVRVQV
jgi:mannose-6-phosphate isomerase-like protein (cupin superfamily)